MVFPIFFNCNKTLNHCILIVFKNEKQTIKYKLTKNTNFVTSQNKFK